MSDLQLNIVLPTKIGGQNLTKALEKELSEISKMLESFSKGLKQSRLENISFVSFYVEDMKGKSYKVTAWSGKKKEKRRW